MRKLCALAVAIVLLGAPGHASETTAGRLPSGDGEPLVAVQIRRLDERNRYGDRKVAFDLFLVRPGADPVRLTRTGKAFAPSPRPDGKRIAFVCRDRYWNQVCTVPAGGGRSRLVTASGGHKSTPSWSPDGRRFGYGIYESGTPNELRTFQVRRRREQVVWREADESVVLGNMGVSWSPDGATLAFDRRATAVEDSPAPLPVLTGSRGWQIWGLDVASGEVRPLIDDYPWQYDPFYSPDGERIVFVTWSGTSAPSQIVHARPDGSDPVQVTRGSSSATSPSFSRDGRWIYFIRDGNVYRTDLLGTQTEVVVRAAGRRSYFDAIPMPASAAAG
ncbi:MAG TPA: hypothetical protein VM573_01645 [Actinomycetota bacterium]|jgi:Tol biopolymer transport system component|nr:hypothetical protein [Actinomycetota bacterium]